MKTIIRETDDRDLLEMLKMRDAEVVALRTENARLRNELELARLAALRHSVPFDTVITSGADWGAQ
jgi:hypothetical protein